MVRGQQVVPLTPGGLWSQQLLFHCQLQGGLSQPTQARGSQHCARGSLCTLLPQRVSSGSGLSDGRGLAGLLLSQHLRSLFSQETFS